MLASKLTGGSACVSRDSTQNKKTQHQRMMCFADKQVRRGGNLAEELLFQLVGPALVGRHVCCQMTNVSTLQQHLH